MFLFCFFLRFQKVHFSVSLENVLYTYVESEDAEDDVVVMCAARKTAPVSNLSEIALVDR